jgi:putative DNA primase/helicase
VLVYCHAGCSFESVLDALEIEHGSSVHDEDALDVIQEWAERTTSDDDHDEDRTEQRRALVDAATAEANGSRIVASYPYHDENGTLVSWSHRFEPKDFRQQSADGSWSVKDVPRYPYMLPLVRQAVAKGDLIAIVEGEKDADALNERGIVATCNPGGAGKWKNDYSEHFRGAHVVILPDNDDPGRKHARRVKQSLRGIAADVKVIELDGLAPKGDVSDWLHAGHTVDELLDLVNGAPVAEDDYASETSAVIDRTDTGNARRLVKRHGADLGYVVKRKRWTVWNGRRWAIDETGAIFERMKDTAIRIVEEARNADERERKAIYAWSATSQSAARIESAVKLARSEPGIPVTPDALDANPWLLNVANGTLDLRTAELRAHRREDLLTKMTNITYDPGATCPLFERYLEEILPDPELRSFLQRAIGYSLTGEVGERCFVILYGTGRNGKTVLLETLRALVGDYGLNTDVDTLAPKKNGGENRGIARLKGVRFTSASEAEEGQRLAASLIKRLTGGDQITARELYAEQFDFEPTHKIWLATNHRPIVPGDDQAVWDRIRLVPFLVRIPEDAQDKNLKQKLRSELPGILAWAVRGCIEWQRDGLGIAEAVTVATDDYRSEMDSFGAFIAERCVVDAEAWSAAAALYAAYVSWIEEVGERAVSKKRFGQRLAERGFTSKKNGAGYMVWRGIGLRDGVTECDGVTSSNSLHEEPSEESSATSLRSLRHSVIQQPWDDRECAS